MTNREVREWYLREVARIAELDATWQARGDSLGERARQAWEHRYELRLRARDMMEDPAEVETLRERDRIKYGRSDGPAFEQLLQRLLSQGRSIEAAHKLIIEAARSTSSAFNDLMQIRPPNP